MGDVPAQRQQRVRAATSGGGGLVGRLSGVASRGSGGRGGTAVMHRGEERDTRGEGERDVGEKGVRSGIAHLPRRLTNACALDTRADSLPCM